MVQWSEVLVILHHGPPGATGPEPAPRTGQGLSDLGLLRALRGQRRRHSFLVPRSLATLSSRDASRFARRKRTGCVELYVQVIKVHPLARATGADRAPSRGTGHGGPQEYRSFERTEHLQARRAEGVDDSSKDFIKSTDEGSILEVAIFHD